MKMNNQTAELQQELQEFVGDKIAQDIVFGLQQLSEEELSDLRESFASLIPYLQKYNIGAVM